MSVISKSTFQRPPYKFEINSNVRHSSVEPISLCDVEHRGLISYDPANDQFNGWSKNLKTTGSNPNSQICDPIAHESSTLTNFEVFLTGFPNSIIDLFEPEKKIDYPIPPINQTTLSLNYLSIEGRIVEPPDNEVHPEAFFVVKLTKPTTVSKISFMGNLLIPPFYDQRGSISNFGLPKTLTVYATNYWPEIIAPVSSTGVSFTTNLLEMFRDWKKVFHSTDFRGLWGWTPISFEPVHCQYLIFIMSELPVLDPNPSQDDIKAGSKIKGLSIPRLGIHSYVQQVNSSKEIQYSPVVSWQSDYESLPDPIPDTDPRFRYWRDRGITNPSQELHQSIFRESVWVQSRPSTKIGLDLLPSALVGFPSQVQIGNDYIFRETYSGDFVKNDDTISTNLVLQVIEDELPFVEGFLIEEPGFPRSDFNSNTLDDSVIDVYYTDDPHVAFSPNQDSDGWNHIGTFDFDTAMEDFAGKQVIFKREINAKFYRFKHSFNENFSGSRRFEISKLSLLRSRHRVLVACKDEILSLDHVRIRMMGPNLVTNQAYVNGEHIMNLIFETSTNNTPFKPNLGLRNILDVRQLTQNQIIPNMRNTRPYYQEFHDIVNQGSRIPSYSIENGVENSTTSINEILEDESRHSRDVDPNYEGGLPKEITSRQKILSVSKQTYLHDENDGDGGISNDWDIPSLLNGIEGVTTDRDVTIKDSDDLSNNSSKKLLSMLTGIDFNTIEDYSKLGEDWSNKDLSGFLSGVLGSVYTPTFDSPGIHLNEKRNAYLNAIYAPRDKAELEQRPSISISGSIGAQFIAGGSIGISTTLDAGKSSSLSTGTQGIANETITKYLYSTITSKNSIPESSVARHSSHKEIIEKLQQYVSKGEEIKFEEKKTDIILMKVPAAAVLRPSKDNLDTHDCYRIRVDLLPDDVELDVTFVGMAQHVPKNIGGT